MGYKTPLDYVVQERTDQGKLQGKSEDEKKLPLS
jgi:hypothetical protein